MIVGTNNKIIVIKESQFQGRGRGRGDHHSTTYRSKSTYKSNVECYRCHRYGHYKSECQTDLNKQSGDQTNFTENEEEVSLLMNLNGRKTTDAEITAIERNDTWELCDLPKKQKTIGVKWVYKTKLKENGEVDKHRHACSKLMAYLPIGREISIPHGDLKEEVIIDQPPGYAKLAMSIKCIS
ncbi:hypothetical protein CK203_071293 [Vitis vinifera]|uniref:CCHC-type domain-containing protein n=1 Tax=Vitis vinifera TaxID=29760 RepID=A0A438ET92_VITVI|nr:hypothetical protein CK203_071293 [Vitis vinifera]